MSSQTRVRVIVAAIAVAAAAVAAVVAWAGRGDEEARPVASAKPRSGVPPLQLDIIVPDAAEWASLRNAQSLYAKGQRAAAGKAFAAVAARNPASLPALIGEAVAAWPHGTISQLRSLARSHPDSGAVEHELGLALLWSGQLDAATSAWQKAGIAELQTPYEQLTALRQRAEHDETERAWLDYGAALQRALRPLSAQAAYDRAVELAPGDPEALTAAAVARFDKDDPSSAIGRLGPLAQRFPNAAVVRFHFGLCLLWLRGFADEGKEQLRKAVAAEPSSVWGREAADLLAKLEQ
jgi:tetratricopeptide (TPR) repeat protein